jgi:CRP-like cAMP-binding protein
MNTSLIKRAINSITPIDEEAWLDFEQYFTAHTLKKGELLWKEGDIVKQVIFIEKGIMRYYYHTDPDGKEVTAQFFFENRLLTDYVSLNLQEPTSFNYQALEDCAYISFPRVIIFQMYDKYKCFERLGRLIAENNFVGQQKSNREIKNISPEEKYRKLMKERPMVVERISSTMIASYLAIAPEQLSRIRKKIMAEKNPSSF